MLVVLVVSHFTVNREVIGMGKTKCCDVNQDVNQDDNQDDKTHQTQRREPRLVGHPLPPCQISRGIALTFE